MAELKQCPKCGASTVSGSWACAFCKHPFEASTVTPPPVQRPTRRTYMVWSASSLIALCGAGFGLSTASHWSGAAKSSEIKVAVDYANWLTDFNSQLREKTQENSGQFARSSPGSPAVARQVAEEERKALAEFMAHPSPAITQRLKNAYGKFLTDDTKFVQNVADGNPDLLIEERKADKEDVEAEIAAINTHNSSVGAELQGFEMW